MSFGAGFAAGVGAGIAIGIPSGAKQARDKLDTHVIRQWCREPAKEKLVHESHVSIAYEPFHNLGLQLDQFGLHFCVARQFS